MAARRSVRRGRRHGGVDGSTVAWGFAAALAVAIVGLGAWYVTANQAAPLDERNCPLDGPVAATLVVLDLTDAISDSQMRRIRREIDALMATAPPGAAVAVGAVRPVAEGLGRTFSACKPPDGAAASILTENPRQIRERYERAFLAPLADVLDEMAVVQGADSSPIMETIQSVIAAAPDWERVRDRRDRRLVLVSDLLQHSDAFSLYRGGGWREFKQTPAYASLSRNLEDADVDFLLIPRPSARGPDPKAVEDFWVGYVDRQGARRSRVLVIGDL